MIRVEGKEGDLREENVKGDIHTLLTKVRGVETVVLDSRDGEREGTKRYSNGSESKWGKSKGENGCKLTNNSFIRFVL